MRLNKRPSLKGQRVHRLVLRWVFVYGSAWGVVVTVLDVLKIFTH